jgi:hypothetical protein
MFLRTLLEIQCNPEDAIDIEGTVNEAFENILGIDVDPNACFATSLSLALLHLVLTDRIPDRLPVVNHESLDYFALNQDKFGTFDAVVANPPYVKWDALTQEMRERVGQLLGDDFRGKADLYSAFLLLSLKLLRPGGYLLFVLPHSFLLSESCRRIRERLAKESSIRVLVDLSEVSVFEGIGSYVILLICQKRTEENLITPEKATYARVRDFPGHALQSVLQQRSERNESYEVFDVPAETFGEEPWIVLPQIQQRVLARLSQHSLLSDLCKCQQGVVTGRDNVFIRRGDEVPTGEEAVWRPFLPDKAISRYRLPENTDKVMFYPFLPAGRLTEADLSRDFPATWQYLNGHYDELSDRAPARRANCEWWQPAWPRNFKDILNRPRLISPHLTISPRFGLDYQAKFLVSRTTMIFSKSEAEEEELLLFIAAILNSSIGFWQLVTTSHKYRSGYAMLEKKNLDTARVPNPALIPRSLVQQIVTMVRKRLQSANDPVLDADIDRLVSAAYGLNVEEREAIGAP